jgi:hypothetical protein
MIGVQRAQSDGSTGYPAGRLTRAAIAANYVQQQSLRYEFHLPAIAARHNVQQSLLYGRTIDGYLWRVVAKLS